MSDPWSEPVNASQAPNTTNPPPDVVKAPIVDPGSVSTAWKAINRPLREGFPKTLTITNGGIADGKVYIGTVTGGHEFTRKDDGSKGYAWDFVGEDGNKFAIYGFTRLNQALNSVAVGSVVRIEYKGKSGPKKKAPNGVHEVDVRVKS